jgi:hypothetical protein
MHRNFIGERNYYNKHAADGNCAALGPHRLLELDCYFHGKQFRKSDTCSSMAIELRWYFFHKHYRSDQHSLFVDRPAK